MLFTAGLSLPGGSRVILGEVEDYRENNALDLALDQGPGTINDILE